MRHILPKPNEIVYTSREDINSIYPFAVVPAKPSLKLEMGFVGGEYEGKMEKMSRERFVAPRGSVLEHFKQS